jgi:4-hydroxy-3-polyprenylbenzoate decarboxylase
MMRIVVGISGASGAILGYRFLEALHAMPEVETHLVVSDGAARTFALETDIDIDQVRSLADVVYDDHDMAAAISSGTFTTAGMVVVPCSMKTVSAIAQGYGSNLLVRAADVCLKERRKLVIVPRESPLSLLHLRNLTAVTEYGGIVVPPMMTWYNGAKDLEEQMDHIVGKVLSQFGLVNPRFKPWTGVPSDGQ